MVSDDTHLLTEDDTKASTSMTKSMDMEYTLGLMVEFTKATGRTESSTGLVSTLCHQETAFRRDMANGKMAPGSNGSVLSNIKI